MLLALIPISIFISIYTFVYQIYFYRRMRLSWVEATDALPLVKENATSSQEKVLRRLLKPFNFLGGFKAIRSFVSRSVPMRLIMAGSPLGIIEFAIFKILSIAFFLILCSIIFKNNKILFMTIGSVIGFIIPELWLNFKIKRRHREIRRDLPLVIDLLNLCVGAGLDFMLAINRVIKDFKKCSLSEELSEVWRETRMGASRREALRNLSRRVNLVELSSFVRTILQVDRMGSPMAEALKIQAEEIRLRRFLQGEEAALKAPIKLLLPLILFILPSVLAIVAGPILLQFVHSGIKL